MNTTILRQFGVMIALVLALSACGLPRDETPQVLDLQDVPRDLRPGQLPTPAPVPALRAGKLLSDQQIFMVSSNGRTLEGVLREVGDSPQELLDTLLLGTFQQEALNSITTAITRETEVQDVQINTLFRLATVDLAPGSLDARNSEQKLAFAQIVFTLTSLKDIDSVQFVQSDPAEPDRDAIQIPVQTDTGTTSPGQRVDRSNFESLKPEAGPTIVIEFEPDIPTPVPTPDPDQSQRFEQAIWKLNDVDQLIKVSRELERNPEALLVGLLSGASLAERERNIRSALPPDALANSVQTQTYEILISDAAATQSTKTITIAFVDLATASLPRADDGIERLLAAAQIVFTLTELIEIDQVVFSVEGVFIPMPTENGLSLLFQPEDPRGLTRLDYKSLLSPDAAITPGLSPTPTPTPGS